MRTDIGVFEASYYLPPTKKPLSQVFEDEEKPSDTFAANVDFERDIGIDALHVAAQETAADLTIEEVKAIIEEAKANPPKRVPRKKKTS